MIKKRKHLHLGWLGIFHDYLVNRWDGKHDAETDQRIGDCLKKGRSYGFSVVDFFSGLSSGKREHNHLNKKVPWVFLKDQKKFDLKTKKRKYFRIFRDFISLVDAAKLEPCPHAIMGRRYMDYPLTRNIQGTNGLWDEKNWKYIMQLGRRHTRLIQEVMGENYKRWGKGVNEASHNGNCERFHQIMYFHERFYNRVIAKKSDIKKYIVDRSHCEGSTGELTGLHRCAKPQCCGRGGIHGKPEFSRHLLKKKSVIPETHKISVKEDFTDFGGIVMPYSGWYRYKYHEDGGSKSGKGKGVRLGQLTFADADQSYELGDYVFGECKRVNRDGIIAWLPAEVYGIHDGFYGSFYSIDRIGDGWDRAEALQQAHIKHYG